jgi:hypothetical protein
MTPIIKVKVQQHNDWRKFWQSCILVINIHYTLVMVANILSLAIIFISVFLLWVILFSIYKHLIQQIPLTVMGLVFIISIYSLILAYFLIQINNFIFKNLPFKRRNASKLRVLLPFKRRTPPKFSQKGLC